MLRTFLLLLLPVVFMGSVASYSLNHAQNMFETIFWELRPFVYSNENGNFTGMFREIFERGHGFCAFNASGPNADFGGLGLKKERRLPTRRAFYQLIENTTRGDVEYGNGLFEGINQSQVIFGPIMSPLDPLQLSKKGFQVFQLAYSNQLAVIVPRSEIALTTKIIYGIFRSHTILLVAVSSSIICCVAIWFVERSLNEDFPDSFTRGCGSAFWWSMASMTTVGYGDLVPRTPIGRLFALFWIFFGGLFGCLMTAKMTEAVSSVDLIDIENQRVAVLENSFEETIVETNYKVNVVRAESYDQIFEMVRSGEAYAGVMVDIVAAWHQEEMHRENDRVDVPLAIVKTIYGPVRVNVIMSKVISEEAKKFMQCLFNYQDEVYRYSCDIYNKYLFLETIHSDSDIYKAFKHDASIRILAITVIVILCVGFTYDVVNLVRMRAGGDDDDDDDERVSPQRYLRWFFGVSVLEKEHWTETLPLPRKIFIE